MANSIELAKLYRAVLDRAFKKGKLTADLEVNQNWVKPTDQAGEVKIAKLNLLGLGQYDRATGYAEGDVSLEWQTFKLEVERSRSFEVDRMDNFETIDLPTAYLLTEFVRLYAVPEMDAIRFAKLAAQAATQKDAAITADNVVAELDTAIETLDDKEIPEDNRILYLSNAAYNSVKTAKGFDRPLNPAANPDRRFQTYDGIPVIKVPKGRFYNTIMLNQVTSSSDKGGFDPAVGAKAINFILMDKMAASGVVKLEKLRYFDADTNQNKDAAKIQMRLYHDLLISEESKNGIYVNTAPAS